MKEILIKPTVFGPRQYAESVWEQKDKQEYLKIMSNYQAPLKDEETLHKRLINRSSPMLEPVRSKAGTQDGGFTDFIKE